MARTHRGRLIAGTVLLLWGGGPESLWAQRTALDFYYRGGQRIPLVIALDTIGVLLQPGVSAADVGAELAGAGLEVGRALASGVLLVGLPRPIPRVALMDSARTMRARYDGLFRTAGLLVQAGPGPPLLVTDQFIVQFGVNVSSAQIDSMNGVYGVDTVAISPFTPNHFLLRVSGTSPGDAIAVANSYHETFFTDFAHPNFYGALEPQAEDPLDDAHFDQQWHLKNDGQTGVAVGERGDLNVVPAWNVTTGDAGITIAVIEMSGFEVAHPDLAPQFWTNPGEIAANATDDDNFGYPDDVTGWDFTGCPDAGLSGQATTPNTPCGDPDVGPEGERPGHGTAVAGLAAASAAGNTGVAGVCPGCRLMLLRVDNSAYAMGRAFAYALHMGADVINVSLSWLNPTTEEVTRINEASSLGRGGHGSVVVFSMDNRRVFSPGNADTDTPRCHETLGTIDLPYVYAATDVLRVGSSTDDDRRALNSPRGDCIELLAPSAVGQGGWGTTATDLTGLPGYNADPAVAPGLTNCQRAELTDQAYTNCFGGTSAAAPMVAGVAGLMLSVNPCLTFGEVRAILRETAKKIESVTAGYDANGFSETHGFGRVDAHAAVSQAGTCLVGDQAAEPPGLEIGTRLGVSWLLGTNDQVVGALPGAGPRAEPIIHLAWLGVPHWMFGAQVGLSMTQNSGSTADESRFVGGLDLAYVINAGGSGVYFGSTAAVQWTQVTGTPASSEFGYGGMLGLRWLPRPFLALRLEGAIRHWPAPNLDEMVLAFGMGVVLH